MSPNNNIKLLALSIALACSNMATAEEQQIDRQQVEQNNAVVKAQNEDKSLEKIVVTGSRIKRDSFSVSTPIATMGAESLNDAGLGSLSDILFEEMPQVSEGTGNGNSQSSVQNTGLSTIDLRELGVSRTLTLIDGRRVVSNSYSGNYVSLSTIPKGMVERVEIITGGASAAYGSDAIAGVVNIITQQDQEGATFSARGGESTEGGAQEYTISADYGTTYHDGRGYLFISTSYDEEKGLSYWDRKRAQQQDSWDYDDDRMCNVMLTANYDPDTKSAYRCMKDIDKSQWTSLSDSIPGGVFDESSSTKPNSGFWYDGTTLRDDWQEELHGIHINQFTMLRVPDKDLSAAVKTEYEFDSGTEAYFQMQYSRNTSRNVKSPESEDECDAIVTYDPNSSQFGSDCIGRIPYDNPYMPEAIRAEASSKGVKWDRLFTEVGNIITSNERTTIRSWGGLRGYIWNDWEWDVSVGYGKFKQEQTRSNEIYVARVKQALNAERLDDGTVQCKDEQARSQGCVPINLFGEGSITPEAADYIRANPSITTDIDQVTVSGFVTGDLFELPAGAVASAFGFEYRKDTQSVSTNVPNGGVTFNYVPTFEGDVSVREIFGELSLPLLKDAPMAKSLSAEVSARIADYSWANTGLIQSYKAGFIYEPIEGYSIRANWARAMRAPTITELMSPPRGDYDSFDDICDGVTATSTDAGHDNCRKDAGIQATIAADGTFEDENNGYSPNSGNSELFEETADTITIGLSLAPSFAPDFRIALDYYDIQIDDAVSSLANEDIIKFCYASSMEFGDGNEFCRDVKRDEEGQIYEVNQRVINTDEIRTKGYDIALEYVYDASDYGSFKVKADWTHVIEYSITSTGPDGQYEDLYEGYLSTDIFEDKGAISLTWYKNDWRVRFSTKYKGAVEASRSRYEDWQAAIEKNNERCATGETTCIANPEPLWQGALPSVTTHSLTVNYSMELGDNRTLSVYGGVNNLFDEKGPFIVGGTGNFDSAYGSGVGRFAFIGAKYQF
ncbi:TonB-dependent receptor [Pseudoalteromonas sp. XMcav11-Q]|uniref:TonB-dependent receptor domain-containing protein n=1 Tax=Pseudoalteromonas sp. XMcav11-Q TaxID=3136665 RepID=UPI0032C4B066